MEFKRSDANMIRTAWELSAGLLSFVVALGLGYWFGATLDRWLGTAPWLLWLFVCFGLAAGVLNVYRTMTRALKPDSGQAVGPDSRTPDAASVARPGSDMENIERP